MINFLKKVIKEDIFESDVLRDYVRTNGTYPKNFQDIQDDLDAQYYVPPEVQQSLDDLKVLYENRKQKNA